MVGLYVGIVLFVLMVLYYLVWKDADPSTLSPSQFQWSSPSDERTKAILEKPSDEKILVVGAGFCGLGVAAALKRHHIPFEVVEADEDIGGNWYHGVYETVHIISSRRTTEYKDRPMPADWPDFPSAAMVLRYLRDYANYYDLYPHIRFCSKVQSIEPLGKGKDSHGYDVILKSNENEETVRYKGVIVANGHHWKQRFPTYEGMDEFAGESMHSKQYKGPEQLKGKRVLVIGGGNSACDIAVEAARFAISSDCSHRRGYWFLPRCIFGIPLVDTVKPWMPLWFQRLLITTVVRISVGSYESYGLQKPDHRLFEHHPTINSELLHFIKLGRIAPHPDVQRIERGTKIVHFVDGSKAEYDLIVYATGYHIATPMLSKEVVEYRCGIPQLVGGLLVPDYKNLYVFGVGQVRYGAGPLITLGADSLAQMIKTQELLLNPMSNILRRIGAGKTPKKAAKSADIIQDPHHMHLVINQANWLLPKLPSVEKLLCWLKLL